MSPTDEPASRNAIRELYALGLSAAGVLQSTGIRRHQERLDAGTLDPVRLEQYADSLHALTEASERAGEKIPIDFWDAQSSTMAKAGIDEYGMGYQLSRPTFLPYVEFLGRCYARMVDFKSGQKATAVATALALLTESAAYVRSGQTLEMTASVPGLDAEQQAILLWQQVLTGTSRRIPFIGRDAYTHFIWSRFNVVEIWNYHTRSTADPNAVWGLTGFNDRFIRDPKNINQIEHMAISAVAQKVLRIPLPALNLLEDFEWLLRWASWIEGQADKALNHAVAHVLLRHFDLNAPQRACEMLEHELAHA